MTDINHISFAQIYPHVIVIVCNVDWRLFFPRWRLFEKSGGNLNQLFTLLLFMVVYRLQTMRLWLQLDGFYEFLPQTVQMMKHIVDISLYKLHIH